MPIGYSIFEKIWKKKEKETFLNLKINQNEKQFYSALNYTIIIGMLLFIIYFLWEVYKKELDLLMLEITMANYLASVVRQQYRRCLLIKYRYFRKPNVLQNILQISWIVVSYAIMLYGFLLVLYYIANITI